MKIMTFRFHHLNAILLLLLLPSLINSYPCPSECICNVNDMTNIDFVRMSFMIDCSHVRLSKDQLILSAESSTIFENRPIDTDDPSEKPVDYVVSIDLTDSKSLKSFDSQTIQFTGFSFELRSLSLASQSNKFQLIDAAFNNPIYSNLETLNLSSCCRQIPIQCSNLFLPLTNLRTLDLSGSDMYKTCLNNPETMSSSLRDLILQNNDFDLTSFSENERIFDGVRFIPGRLDLKYSRFQFKDSSASTCILNIFERISQLDLSSIQFSSSNSKSIDENLKRLIQCENSSLVANRLKELYLRDLNLERLPSWLTIERFPNLDLLDLSTNSIRSIDLSSQTSLNRISLAFNPIEWNQIIWSSNFTYTSINLRSTVENRHYNFNQRLNDLSRLTMNFDYSENAVDQSVRIDSILTSTEFPRNEISLNLSRLNIVEIDWTKLTRFDSITRLDLSFNHLTILDLRRQNQLSFLQCSNQNLTRLVLNPDNEYLIELNCSSNALTTIDNFSSMKNQRLKLIDLSSNRIDRIESILSNFKSRYLRLINLKSNRIEKIPSNTFHRDFLSLNAIDLSNNRINLIETNAFQSMNLQHLDLSGNPLKTVESQFLFTGSLRLFYLINHSQELIDHCANSTTNDPLLLNYITWFELNGTYMRNIDKDRSEQIQTEKCLRPYLSRSKTKWINIRDRQQMKHLSLYITMGVISVGIILGVIYLYRKNRIHLMTALQRYRPLDRNHLVDHTDDNNQIRCDEDEIVMNLEAPPYNNTTRRT